MRKLRSFQVPGISAAEVLDEFNERAEELGIQDENDIVSVSVGPPTTGIGIVGPGGSVKASVEVTIVYWSER
jgi:hypothetical protein